MRVVAAVSSDAPAGAGISAICGEALCAIPSSISGVEGCRPQGVCLKNVDLVCRGEGAERTARQTAEPGPEFADVYPEATMFKNLRLPAFGLYADREADVKLDNVRCTLKDGETDRRPAVFLSGTH